MALRLLAPNEKARNMGCLVWVEDLERAGATYGDYLGFVADLMMPCVVSPVHDRDTYTAEDVRGWKRRHLDPDTGDVADEYTNRVPVVGGPKKPHIHTYFSHKGWRTPIYMSSRFDEFITGLVASNRWVYVENWAGAVRYCAHMDSPSKAQYSPFDVFGFCNADVTSLSDDRNVDKLAILLEIDDAIEAEDICNYWALNRWAKGTGDREIMNLVKGRTGYFAPLLAARNARRKAERSRQEADREFEQVCKSLRNGAEDVSKHGGSKDELIG